MRRLAGSILDWLKSLYGPSGSMAHTPYFYGKPFLARPIIEAILRYEYFLPPDMADELVSYVQDHAGTDERIALKFEDIAQYRMRDVDNLFESFFESKGISDDPSVQQFANYVRSDLIKAWDIEFTGPQPEKQQEEPKPAQPRPATPAAPSTQPALHSPAIDFLDSIREAADSMPEGSDITATSHELLELFLRKSGWAVRTSSSVQEQDYVAQAKAAIDEFLAKQPDRLAWEPFTRHLMQTLYRKWNLPQGGAQIGTLQSRPKKTVIPYLKSPKPPERPQDVPSSPSPTNAPKAPSQDASPLGIRRKHYDDTHF